MKVGTVKEIKNHEYRVGLTPQGVSLYVENGHEVFVEKGAGVGSGFSDDEYAKAGAKLVNEASKVWQDCDMIVKVKEPIESEYGYFKKDQVLYTYLHLANEPELTKALMDKQVKAVAFEPSSNPTRNSSFPSPSRSTR